MNQQEKQMAACMQVIETTRKETVVEALIESCRVIVGELRNKKATGKNQDFLAARLAASFVQDCRGAGRKREILNQLIVSKATIN